MSAEKEKEDSEQEDLEEFDFEMMSQDDAENQQADLAQLNDII